jgi:hypothetical protein
MTKNKVLLFLSLFFIILIFLNRDIPFFWSGTFFSEQAVTFFNFGFNNLISPLYVDAGGFPLYSIYLALVWKVLGKTLLVSHFAMLPFILGIMYEYYKLANRFLKGQVFYFAIVLLLLEPTFITQSILMGYDLLMVYFFFLALNSLFDQKKFLFVIAAVLLCLSSVRGGAMLFSILLIDLIFQYQADRKIKWSGLLKYIYPFIFVVIWAIYHHTQTGWYLFSPTRVINESLVSFMMLVRQMLYTIWKIIDFGRIVLCLVVFIGVLLLFKKEKNNIQFKQIIVLVLVPILVLLIFLSAVSNPVGHRYFISVFLLLNIAACFMLEKLMTVKKQVWVFVIIAVSLIAGNFWMYPERFGNGWDSSLKILPYFKLQKEVDQFIVQNKIKPSEIASQFPFVADVQFSYLADSSSTFINFDEKPVKPYHYFLQSNLINTLALDEIENLKKDWTLLKEFKSGQIYIALYQVENSVDFINK